MTQLRVLLPETPQAFRPGQIVEAEAQWELSESADELELRLCWTTDGQGSDEDPVVVRTETIKHPPKEGNRKFRLSLPAGPWSFEGKLFSIQWYVELALGSQKSDPANITLSLTGEPIRMREPEPDSGSSASTSGQS